MINSNKSKLNKRRNPSQANAETVQAKAKTIKLGIDVHLDRYVVVRQLDGGGTGSVLVIDNCCCPVRLDAWLAS